MARSKEDKDVVVDEKFRRLVDEVIKENRTLLERLAKK